ncbi:hypothetical protein Y032_0191g1297 [Ancylostoma ceylanicum]|uniref:Uncharacterized protein n=1 Tax=Ancylostoma ceylanicum TaxID=53326 RepID=A0A016SQR4_9BILA|nr:hypothetical protein Y032_0191g1297 [Ancylostoma ceylanicum]
MLVFRQVAADVLRIVLTRVEQEADIAIVQGDRHYQRISKDHGLPAKKFESQSRTQQHCMRSRRDDAPAYTVNQVYRNHNFILTETSTLNEGYICDEYNAEKKYSTDLTHYGNGIRGQQASLRRLTKQDFLREELLNAVQ